jgi:shikimate dehydrogenase
MVIHQRRPSGGRLSLAVKPMTDRYAVFGNPVAHSKSPRIHALFAVQTGQDIAYASILAPLDGFASAVGKFVAEGGRGANVTVPFKEQASKVAGRLSPRAQAAGAVNTLTFINGEIAGDNTDGVGLVRDIVTNFGERIGGRRVLLLGAGGAARGAVLPLLLERPAELIVANRTAEKARQLAAEFARLPACAVDAKPVGCGFAELAGHDYDMVINATSAGLGDATLDLPSGIFAAGSFAYEMVYGRETDFMTQARRAGASVADGLGMLVEQAAEAFFVWRCVRPDTFPVLAQLRGEC